MAPDKLSGYKEIADYLKEIVGVTFSIAAVRAHAARDRDPLPVRVFGDPQSKTGGRAIADRKELEEWAARQWRPKTKWRKKGAA